LSLHIAHKAKKEGFHEIKNQRKRMVQIGKANELIYTKLCRFRDPGNPSPNNKFVSEYSCERRRIEWERQSYLRTKLSKARVRELIV